MTTRTRAGGREALLEATVGVIAEHGWGGVTVRAVAERAKVSPGTVTYHFDSADSLLVAALEFGAGQTAQMLEQLALDLQQTDWGADAWSRAFVSALAHDLEANRPNHLACFELQLLAARRPELAESAMRIRLAYFRVSRMALQAQGMSGPELELAAVNLTALVTGLCLSEIASPQPGIEQRLSLALGVIED
ncbi:MAG: TetR/AcrR family transcriptional regulator [Solirubrobacterales bacterium]